MNKFYAVRSRDTNDMRYEYPDQFSSFAYFKNEENAIKFMLSEPEFVKDGKWSFGPMEYEIVTVYF